MKNGAYPRVSIKTKRKLGNDGVWIATVTLGTMKPAVLEDRMSVRVIVYFSEKFRNR